jgi:hypothetical protein
MLTIRFLILLLLPVLILAQENAIPNAGFENWTDGEPNDWISNNNSIEGLIPVIQSTDSHSGNSALEMTILPYDQWVYFGLVGSDPSSSPVLDIFETNPAALEGYHKFSPVGASFASIGVTILTEMGVITGTGSVLIEIEYLSYTKFSVPITYISQEKAKAAVISITLSGGLDAIGAKYLLDDLSFSGSASSIDESSSDLPLSFKLNHNHPNPFNPNTAIGYQLPTISNVELSIYNLLGEKVATLVSERQAAGVYQVEWDAAEFPSGVYYYKIEAGQFQQVRKMMLIK